MTTAAAKAWLPQYPEGVPAEIDPATHASLKEVIEDNFQRFATRPAFTNMGATLSYAELDRLSANFGSFLQNHLGLQHGARVAIMMPNLLQYPVAVFGALRVGMTAVNVNPLYTPRELRHQLQDAGVETIVILENFAHVLAGILPETEVKNVVIARIGDMLPGLKGAITNFAVKYIKKMVPAWHIVGAVPFNQALRDGALNPLRPVDVGPDDIAFLQYTGGTTGVAKGAVLTHGNMVANVLQTAAWLGVELEEGTEVIITALPLYHIFSLTTNCLVFSKLGGLNVLITNPRDMPGFIKELGKQRFSVITGVNTLFNGLLNTAGFDQVDFGSLKLSVGGGMAVQKAVADRWQQVTGNAIVEGYGLTETSPVACANPINITAYTGAIGLPVPSTDVAIRDENGADLPVGETGELCIKGPQVMRGYWNRPEETAKVLDDGWLRTGDMAVMDAQGYVRIVDRKKDMILVSGFNVYPNEIEDVLAMHPKVLESAAVGIDDDRSGELVKVFVVKKDPSLTEQDIIAHCKSNLTGYKVPKQVEFREDLPKSNVGKILRRELRDSA